MSVPTGEQPRDNDAGHFLAVVATEGWVAGDPKPIAPLGVQLLDGNTRIVISPWGHSSILDDTLPVGFGVLSRVGSDIIATGEFFLENTSAREAWAVLRRHGGAMKWSLGFSIQSSAPPSPEDRERGVERWLTKITPFEATMTNTPANWKTRTLMLKSRTHVQAALEHIRAGHAHQVREAAEQLKRINQGASEILARGRRLLQRVA